MYGDSEEVTKYFPSSFSLSPLLLRQFMPCIIVFWICYKFSFRIHNTIQEL